MPLKLGQISFILRELKPLFVGGAAFCVWVALCQKGVSERAGLKATERNLTAGTKLIKAFVQEFHDIPQSMVELKAYAAIHGSAFRAFDGFGNALDYLPLNDQQYLLRSFGSDGIQNTLSSDMDIAVGLGPDLPTYGAQYRYQKALKPHVYPSPLTLGSYAPNGMYYAQIYHDQRSGTRKLLIRSEKSFAAQVAPHDFVEEYLWLADSRQILFTATSSARYEDGIYLWDLETGETANLLGKQASGIGLNSSGSDTKYFLSLAGASHTLNEALVFVKAQNAKSLNPAEFFQPSNLYRINIGAKTVAGAKISLANDLSTSQIFQNLDPLQNLVTETAHNKIYQAFGRLSFRGPIEPVISGWQQFTSEHGTSVLIPYCLWLLSSIYDDAYQLIEKSDREGAQTLRSYGTELANALAQMPAAPSYLRAFGQFNLELLYAGQPLPYRVSELRLK